MDSSLEKVRVSPGLMPSASSLMRGRRALTDNEIVTKFMENAALAVSRPCAEHIQNIVLDLENHCVRELGRALTGQ